MLPGVDYHAIDIIGDDAAAPLLALTADLSRLRSADDSVATAQGIYRAFVAGARQRRGHRSLLEAVARSDGSIVVHCTAGKDRTGWSTALLHYIAGVDHTDIMSDYLMTNTWAKDAIAKALDKVRRSEGARAATTFEPFLRVDTSYLDAALDEASHRYG